MGAGYTSAGAAVPGRRGWVLELLLNGIADPGNVGYRYHDPAHRPRLDHRHVLVGLWPDMVGVIRNVVLSGRVQKTYLDRRAAEGYQPQGFRG